MKGAAHAVAVLATTMLLGCASHEQRADLQARQDVVRWGDYCTKRGFTTDTVGWRDCIRRQANSPD